MPLDVFNSVYTSVRSRDKMKHLSINENNLQKLKSSFAKYNNELLLPRCLQKTIKQHSSLSALKSGSNRVSAFKLKNYCRPRGESEDEPVCPDESKTQKEIENNKFNQSLLFKTKSSNFMNTTCISFKSHKSRLSGDISGVKLANSSFSRDLCDNIIHKSRSKYNRELPIFTQQKIARRTNPIVSRNSQDSTLGSFHENYGSKNSNSGDAAQQQQMLNTSCSMFSCVAPSTSSTRRSMKQSIKKMAQNMNSTRTRRLLIDCSSKENFDIEKGTSLKDVFPLDKLLKRKGNMKGSFRNKWFENRIQEEETLRQRQEQV